MTKGKPPTDIEMTSPRAVKPVPRRPENLNLNTAAPKVEPALSQLETWAQSVLNNERQTDTNPTTTISRYGLKTAQDVITFIRSPEGKNVLAEINEQKAISDNIQHDIQMEQREHDVLMRRLMAAAFLWFLNKKAHAHHQQQELIIEQNAKAIEASGKPLQAAATKISESTRQKELRSAIADYDKALNMNQDKLTSLDAVGTALEAQMSKLMQQKTMIDDRYTVFENALGERFENSILGKFGQSTDAASKIKVEKAIAQIMEEMDAILIEVDQLIARNEDEAAKYLMLKHIALNTQLASHHDMVATSGENRKQYYADENGDEVTSFKEAFFILDIAKNPDPKNPGQFLMQPAKIVKDNGKFYLLKPGQTWDDLQNNTVLKAQAEKDFELQKPTLLAVNKLMTHNKKLETKDNTLNVIEVQAKKDENTAAKILIHNENTMLTAGRSQMIAMLNQPTVAGVTPRPIMPTPTATPGHSASPRPSLATASIAATQYYKEQLQELQKQGISYDSVGVFRDKIALRGDSPRAIRLTEELKNIPRTGPIPYLTMQTLLKNMARIGADPTKPSVTPIKSPLELQQEPTTEPSTTPSPFNTGIPKPTPWNTK